MILFVLSASTLPATSKSCSKNKSCLSKTRQLFFSVLLAVYLLQSNYGIISYKYYRKVTKMKESGILLHISSLPSKYGIGTLGQAAYGFADFLAETGQKYWQILPLGVTGYGNSPYQSASSFAGNPYFIDFDLLEAQGLLHKDEYQNINWGGAPDRIDYGVIYSNRYAVLRAAAARLNTRNPEYKRFCRANAFWLDDFALFMAIKEHFGMVSFDSWDTPYIQRDAAVLSQFSAENKQKLDFYKITQFFFYQQASALKAYLNGKGIRLIGDIPFYTAYDSADVWANPKQFKLDGNLMPQSVAGVPPDAFSATGQLWGNPLYDFEVMAGDGYKWWKSRIKQALTLCDIIRVDHFRAFESYYTIPYGSKDATVGKWVKGVGGGFFDALKLERSQIIAEDLGIITDAVRELIDYCGFKSMKVLQFAFDGKKDNTYLVRNYKTPNCVVYTGTHDNDTTQGWYSNLDIKARFEVLKRLPDAAKMPITKALIRCAAASKAELAIIPMQDYLGLGSGARINTPATIGGNWEWRLDKDYNTPQLRKYIKSFGRLRKNKQ